MSGRGWPDPRSWTGDSAFPWPPAAWLQPGDPIVACYTILSLSRTRDDEGAAILELELADASGTIVSWIPADAAVDWVRPGLYIGVRGTVEVAADRPVLLISELSPVEVGLDDLALFLPHSAADAEVLEEELDRLAGSIAHPGLRALVERMLGADTETGRGFRLAPAATRNHHACLGGLFEHTVSVARLCEFAATHYGDAVNRDLLVAGALLHDIGKVREIGARAGFPYTDEGRLLGHILLGLRMVAEAAREVQLDPESRLLLEHLIASHQGRFEWQSPREPQILEAFILHYIDDLDAKIDHVRTALDTVDAGWTEYDRSLRRELLRHAPETVDASTGRVDSRAVTADTPDATPAAGTRVEGGDRPSAAGLPTGPEAESGKRATAKRKRTRKKTAKKAKKRTAKAKRTTGRKPAGNRTTRKEAIAPDRAPSRSTVIEPGMPGFIDTDTLDLFEES